MADLDDENREEIIPDVVEDSIIAHTDLVGAVRPSPHTRRTRVVGEISDGSSKGGAHCRGQFSQQPQRPRGQRDSVGDGPQLLTELFLDCFPWDNFAPRSFLPGQPDVLRVLGIL